MNQHVRRLDADAHHLSQHQHHRMAPFLRCLLEPFQPRLLDLLDLHANQRKPGHVTAQLRQSILSQRHPFPTAYLLKTLRGLAIFHIEVADAVPDHRRFHPVDNPAALTHQVLMLAVRPPGVFLRKCRDRRHAAVLRLAAQPTEKRPHQQSRIQPISLRSPMLARHRDAGRVDHIGFDAALPQPPRQPEAVAASLEGHHNPFDLAAGFDRLLPPAIQKLHNRFRISTLLLQRLPGEAGNKTGNQPRLQTQFNHRNQRAILIKGDEGSAQIVPLHGTLHSLSFQQQRWCHTSSPPHSISPPLLCIDRGDR